METSENFLEGIKDVLPSADFDIGASDDENEVLDWLCIESVCIVLAVLVI